MKKVLRIIKKKLSLIRYPIFLIRNNTIGKGTYVSSNVHLRKCKIGQYCHIGPNSSYNCAIIGNYCSFATDVMIGGEEHSYWDLSTSNYLSRSGITELKTHIGNDVWIGAQCYIKQGVHIGNGVVVGANSFVNTDIPDYAIVVGSPARIIKYRFNKLTINYLNQSEYWKYCPEVARNILLNIKSNLNIK